METIGYAALQIIPSMKGTKSQLEKELGAATGAAGTKSGGGIGKRILSGMGTTLKRGAAGVGIVAGGVVATGLAKGFGRLNAIDQAEAKLRGLGHSAGDIAGIMTDVGQAVTGTAFGLDEGATAAASALASGIKPGKELAGYLTLIGDTATQGGTSFNEMASIINKTTATGKVGMENLNQLSERGIGIMSWLADEYGVTGGELAKMVSQGQVDVETFRKVLNDNIGGAAQESGNTFSGALANMQAALGRTGAKVLSGAFSQMPGIFSGVGRAIDAVGPYAEKLGEVIGGGLTTAVGWLSDKFKSIDWGPIKSALGDVADRAGTLWSQFKDKLLPEVERLAGIIATNLSPVIGAIAPVVLEFAGVIADNLIPAVSGVIGFLNDYQELFIPLAAGIAAVVTVLQAKAAVIGVVSGVTKTWTAVQAAFNAVMAMNPIMLVVLALVGLGVALVVAWKKSETFRNIITGAWEGIKKATLAAFDMVKKIIGKAIDVVKNIFMNFTGPGLLIKHWDKIKQVTRNTFNAVRNTVRNVFDRIKGIVTRAGDAVRNAVSGAWDKVKSITSNLWGGITGAVSGAVDKMIGFVTGIKGKVTGALSGAKNWLSNAGKDVVRGLGKGIESMYQWVRDKVDALTGWIPGWVKRKLGIASPSKVMARLAIWIPRGIAKGIGDGASSVEKAMKDVTARIEKAGKKATTKANKQQIARAVQNAKGLANAQTKSTKKFWKRGGQGGTDFIVKNIGRGGSMAKALRKQNLTLADIAKARGVLAGRLAKAQAQLADAVKMRDEFKASVVDGVRAFTSMLHAAGQVNEYGFQQAVTATDITSTMRDRLAVTEKFTDDMAALLDAGLNKRMYEELVAAGPEAAGDYAAALVAGGDGAISEVNKIQGQINKAANKLGNESSKALFQSGVDTAKGLVNGIESQMGRLDKVANKMGKTVAKAIKKALGIASPSKVAAMLGRYVPAGLAVGMGAADQLRRVASAASAMAGSAVSGVESALSRQADASALADVIPIRVTVAEPKFRGPHVPDPFGPGGPGAAGAAAYAGPRVVVNQEIHNPVAEATSKTIDEAARTLGMVGGL